MAALSASVVAFSDLLPGSRANIGNRLSATENLAPTPSRFYGIQSIVDDSKRSTVSVRARSREYSRRLIRVHVNPSSSERVTIRSVPVQVARELINAGHHFLDVRTVEEFAAGHVEGAVNVPYFKSAGGGMTKNLHFVEEVTRHFDKDDEVVVGCMSGKRSLMAAAELLAAEFTAITDMVGGHKAWVDSGLPSRV